MLLNPQRINGHFSRSNCICEVCVIKSELASVCLQVIRQKMTLMSLELVFVGRKDRLELTFRSAKYPLGG